VARGIELTDEQVQAFLAADADGDGVDLDEFLDSLDDTELGMTEDLEQDRLSS
jgi:hypothetical protein